MTDSQLTALNGVLGSRLRNHAPSEPSYLGTSTASTNHRSSPHRNDLLRRNDA